MIIQEKIKVDFLNFRHHYFITIIISPLQCFINHIYFLHFIKFQLTSARILLSQIFTIIIIIIIKLFNFYLFQHFTAFILPSLSGGQIQSVGLLGLGPLRHVPPPWHGLALQGAVF
jgi:hypothetical protein